MAEALDATLGALLETASEDEPEATEERMEAIEETPTTDDEPALKAEEAEEAIETLEEVLPTLPGRAGTFLIPETVPCVAEAVNTVEGPCRTAIGLIAEHHTGIEVDKASLQPSWSMSSEVACCSLKRHGVLAELPPVAELDPKTAFAEDDVMDSIIEGADITPEDMSEAIGLDIMPEDMPEAIGLDIESIDEIDEADDEAIPLLSASMGPRNLARIKAFGLVQFNILSLTEKVVLIGRSEQYLDQGSQRHPLAAIELRTVHHHWLRHQSMVLMGQDGEECSNDPSLRTNLTRH
ncbi:hypothetical protein KCV07_g414, partial [Aureobasidium melanogenum]